MADQDPMKEWSSTKKFEDQKIKEEELQKVFEKATNAPTAFNLQPYEFIVLDSEEEMEKAVSSAHPVNGWIQYADKIVVLVGYEDIDRNAEKVLERKIENGEKDAKEAENLREMFESYMNRGDEFMTGWLSRNTMIPATFFMLACKEEGIGSCPVRGFSQQNLSDKLELEDEERPMLLFPIGYPKENDRSWRRDAEDIYEFR